MLVPLRPPPLPPELQSRRPHPQLRLTQRPQKSLQVFMVLIVQPQRLQQRDPNKGSFYFWQNIDIKSTSSIPSTLPHLQPITHPPLRLGDFESKANSQEPANHGAKPNKNQKLHLPPATDQRRPDATRPPRRNLQPIAPAWHAPPHPKTPVAFRLLSAPFRPTRPNPNPHFHPKKATRASQCDTLRHSPYRQPPPGPAHPPNPDRPHANRRTTDY